MVDGHCKGGGYPYVGMGANLLRGVQGYPVKGTPKSKIVCTETARHQKIRNLAGAMASIWLRLCKS